MIQQATLTALLVCPLPVELVQQGNSPTPGFPAFEQLNETADRLQEAAEALSAQTASSGASPAPTKQSGDTTGGSTNDAPSFPPQVEVSSHGTVDVSARGSSLSEVLDLLAIQTRRNIALGSGAERPVTVNFRDLDFETALETLLEPNGLGVEVKGQVLVVQTIEDLKARGVGDFARVSKVLQVDYLRSEDARDFVAHLLSADGSIEVTKDDTQSSGSSGSSSSSDSSTSTTLTAGSDSDIYSPEVDEYDLRNAIVVHDYVENVERIESFLEELDVRPRQLMVEVSIIETGLTEDTAFGVDFAVLGSEADYLDFIQSPLGGASSSEIGFLETNAAGDTITSPPAGGFGVSGVGQTQASGGVRAGYVGSVSVFLRALDSVTDVNILSNPKVLTLNRQRSKIHVGAKNGYSTAVTNGFATTENVQFIDSGIVLDLRPFILSDGRVRLELNPSVSVVTFLDGVPQEALQSVQTDILLPPGYTAVVGGLFTESTTRNQRQVPILGDIPLLGELFRGEEDNVADREIIFLVKPVILEDEQLEEMGETALRRTGSTRFGARRDLLFWSRERRSTRLNLKALEALEKGDAESARWNLRRSLGLNQLQPEIYDALHELDMMQSLDEQTSALDHLIKAEHEAVRARMQRGVPR